jgi:D-alanine-D-alanine ligase
MRVGLVFGGRSVEHLVSLRSARTVRDGLRQAGHDVVCLGIAESGAFIDPAVAAAHLDEGARRPLPEPPPGPAALQRSLRVLVDANVDALFPIVHGTYGEDGTLQGLCEMLDLPYVGCGVTASALAMDKLQSKRVFEAAGLPVVPWWPITRAAFDKDATAALAPTQNEALPLFVKPSVGGSSVGCVKVKARADLADAVRFALRFDDAVLIERCVTAREIEVAVLTGQGGDVGASVVGEIVPGADFYDYADKYLKDDAKLLAPAPLDDAVAARVRDTAVQAFLAIGGHGLARVDFFLVGDDLYLNEINTLPGFTDVSMYPRLWGLSGVPLPDLCDRLVQRALERHAARKSLDDGVRAFVNSAAAGAAS